MPTSRARTAICSAPLLWPSRPGFPTSTLSGRPRREARACTRSRTSAVRSPGWASARATTPVGARYSPKSPRSTSAHSPVVTPACAARIEGGITFPPAETTSRRFRSAASASLAPRAEGGELLHLLALRPHVDAQDRLVPRQERRGLRLGVAVHAHHHEVPALDRARAAGLRLDELLLHPGVLDRRDAAPHREHAVELGARLGAQRRRVRLDHLRAVEEVLVLEEVRLVGQDLLDAQRPLLVPGAREA